MSFLASLSTKHARDLMRAIEPIMAAAGGTCRLDPGGTKHGKLFLLWHGRERHVPVASSPRDSDVAVKKKISDVRRLLREMGANP